MYRFFVDASQIEDGSVLIEGKDAHHIKNVLRMKKGETIYLSCGDEWEYTCDIEEFLQNGVRAKIIDIQKPGQELPCKITLFQCLPKKEKMELIIQKSVELGVFSIVPVESARCIAKNDPKKIDNKLSRWNAIAQAAAKQSKRLIEPTVEKPVAFKEALKLLKEKDVAFVPYERAEGMKKTRELFQNIASGQSVGLLIGPEGGFEEKEIEAAKEAGLETVSLGKRILRTETAGPAVLAILMYLLEQDGE